MAIEKNEKFVQMIVSCAAGMFENSDVSQFVSYISVCFITCVDRDNYIHVCTHIEAVKKKRKVRTHIWQCHLAILVRIAGANFCPGI